MKRRDLIRNGLAALSGAVGLLFAGRAQAGEQSTRAQVYGRIAIEEHGCGYSVRLNGREVSGDCFEANDVEGYVRVYKRDGTGRFYLQHAPTCRKPESRVREYYKDESGALAEIHANCDQIASERLTGKVQIHRWLL